MKRTYAKIAITLAIAVILISTIPVCLGQDTQLSYQLLNKPDGNTTYQLEVVIPQQLNSYFGSESHRLSSADDFAKFITPYALKPIADRLWQIYDNDEDFANGVLMLVHQIAYVETQPGYYPTETMVAKKGDCDLFAYIAASIMKAGGLNVSLFYYEEQGHMNMGVQLSSPPTENRGEDYYVVYNNVTYYVAECTGGNWKQGWRVGESPGDYKGVSTQVIPLDEPIQVDPGQVSASFSVMQSSSLSLDVSPIIKSDKSSLTIKGQINPQIQSQNVTVYAKINMSPWEVIGSTLTKPDGSYEITVQSQASGLYIIQASWSGDDNYTGALSITKSALLLPNYLMPLIIASIIAACLGTFALVQKRRNNKKAINQQSDFATSNPGLGSDFQI